MVVERQGERLEGGEVGGQVLYVEAVRVPLLVRCCEIAAAGLEAAAGAVDLLEGESGEVILGFSAYVLASLQQEVAAGGGRLTTATERGEDVPDEEIVDLTLANAQRVVATHRELALIAVSIVQSGWEGPAWFELARGAAIRGMAADGVSVIGVPRLPEDLQGEEKTDV